MNTHSVTLLLGGVRSGKSNLAQSMLMKAERVAMIATAEALDEEMSRRIARHKADRPSNWTTIESPLALEAALEECSGKYDAVLIDCLTLWTSNLMYALHNDSSAILKRVEKLCEVLSKIDASVVLVSNEVGSGIMPMNADARLYVDLLGAVNRQVAAVADRVLLLVAGIPMTVKDTTGEQK